MTEDNSTDARPEYLTARQLADLLQVSDEWVRRSARDGRIPDATKVGSQWRFPTDSLPKIRQEVGQRPNPLLTDAVDSLKDQLADVVEALGEFSDLTADEELLGAVSQVVDVLAPIGAFVESHFLTKGPGGEIIKYLAKEMLTSAREELWIEELVDALKGISAIGRELCNNMELGREMATDS